MRRYLVLIAPLCAGLPAYAGSPAWPQNQSFAPRLEVDQARIFAVHAGRNEDTDVMLRGSMSAPPAVEMSLQPAISLGPFRATLGGADTETRISPLGTVVRGHPSLGAYDIDTHTFLNSHVNGSFDGRGGRINFSVPLP